MLVGVSQRLEMAVESMYSVRVNIYIYEPRHAKRVLRVILIKMLIFLARRDECPESYCRTPGVGVGVGVGVRVYKNFYLAYNS